MQSIWVDFIRDDFLDAEFAQLLARGASGATSNPSIFKAALENDAGYKARLAALPAGLSATERFDAVAIADIKKAAAIMAHIHAANPAEGFISYEISPLLANDYAASTDAALRVVDAVNAPNLMIKLPATPESIRAMQTLASKGVNINATLIFSPAQARECTAALAAGYAEFAASCPNARKPQAVVSIFVSRLDSALNCAVAQKFQIGVENAIVCAQEVFAAGCENIRPLFASTGTKCEALHKAYYIAELAFARTINTAPLEAIEHARALTQAGYPARELSAERVEAARAFCAQVSAETLASAYDSLLQDGLAAFKTAYAQILELCK